MEDGVWFVASPLSSGKRIDVLAFVFLPSEKMLLKLGRKLRTLQEVENQLKCRGSFGGNQ
jgi:hypothetical protein